jgi:hypothetical protein
MGPIPDSSVKSSRQLSLSGYDEQVDWFLEGMRTRKASQLYGARGVIYGGHLERRLIAQIFYCRQRLPRAAVAELKRYREAAR